MQCISDILPYYNLAKEMIKKAETFYDEESREFLNSDFGKKLKNEVITFENLVEEFWNKYEIEEF
jgi:hypothetical protein